MTAGLSTAAPATAADASCGSIAGNLVSNCSFETPLVGAGSYAAVYPGHALGAWAVGRTIADAYGVPGDAVDLVNVSFHGGYPVADGVQSLDLNHDGPGGVYQDVSTEEGKAYQLTFSLAGFPTSAATECSGAATATNPQTLTVTAGASEASFSYSPDPSIPAGTQVFAKETVSFVGAGATTRVSFNGTNPGCTGSIIDDVSVVAAVVVPPTDLAPLPSAGGPYAGDEGSPVTLAGTVSDDGASAVSTLWTYTAGDDVDAGATCQFADATLLATTVTCTDDGTYTLTLRADDAASSATSTAVLTVGNVAPTVTATTAGAGACSASLAGGLSDAGINDTHTASIAWGDGAADPAAVSEQSGAGTFGGTHVYAGPGTYTVTAQVADDDAATATSVVSFTTRNHTGAFLPPMNATGSRSVFKLGSTVPVKIVVSDCAGAPVTSLLPAVSLVKVDSMPDGSVNETPVDAAPTNGRDMWWNGTAYQYNLSTKNSQLTGGPLSRGTYRLTVSEPSLDAPASIVFDLT